MKKTNIAIIGLGYVGLPLAVEFGNLFNTVGFDINKKRISELNNGFDITKECSSKDISESKKLSFSYIKDDLKKCNVYIVTVPTPINKFKKPDLSFLLNATKMIAQLLNKNDIVIYESTVYPGCTEDDCVPVLEKYSNLKYNEDFYCGYSPERINPGDKINKLTNIMKVTSGSNSNISDFVDNLYKKIIKAGTFKASSIKVAEASKAIENAQRDLNISFVNELSIIFEKIGIDTNEVLDAAGTKWNFMKFKPGLVGGHCIGVDPYYLAHKAESLGYYPEVILSGRRVNDRMPTIVANNSLRLMLDKDIKIKKSKALILGITFKENCPDIRNSKIPELYHELVSFGIKVDVFDPYADKKEVLNKYKIKLISSFSKYELIILAVGHNKFHELNLEDIKLSKKCVVYDLKCFLDKNKVDKRL